MSVLIKGMEMPENCASCELCFNGFCCVLQQFGGEFSGAYVERMKDCPLIELPPQGDLISREWLVDISLHLMNIAKNDDIANGVKWLWQYVIEAPTIIEAEGEKT